MSIFSIGVSGLNSAQTVLATTSTNISNVYTPGYNRQLPQLSESIAGGGVQVANIERQFNQFVSNQLNRSNSVAGGLSSYHTQVSQIDNLMADREAGLAPLMRNFFSALEDVVASPADPAARQGVLGAAETLSGQFRAFDGYLSDMQRSLGGQIKDQVTQINNSTEQIAKLNREISLAKAKTGEAPNGLLNQRDQLVAELSQRVDARLTIQDGDTYNLSLSNGLSLVSGSNSFKLEAMRSSEEASRIVVGYRDGSGNLLEFADTTFREGELGGLMTFRRETLDRTQNQLGQLAVSLAVAFNQQHAEGVDLYGETGGDFFAIGQPVSFSNGQNRGDASLSASYDPAALDSLTASDYDVSWTAAAGYSVIRRDIGTSVDANYDEGNGTLSFAGMSVQVSGTPADGDRFVVQPTRRAAGQMASSLTDPARIAAGQPVDGSGSGDNRNALKLQALQTRSVVGGQATLNQSYAAMVSDVGNRTNIAAANLAVQQGLNEQLRGIQQAESGVNLDEEAANLIRYQQFYQANAKVIEIGAAVLDTLLGIRA
ncbi:flagellar hook-associated protein 1 FlgK [Geopseudomonas sagittaria]|uniref:Flagellar hook-associated protein 1 n=1 Tax=Geopseudomonas sagittaria TaxID=1135990 RepID=A0A1I5QD14_9GAMM|nr:flagellar hook-associated protein FlgK [Pseudomonas sagittaria]MCM2318455.1 flagellar hook-associated protein FlgK [Pseudomonas sp.]SFP44123.1 flagellar hook-associated protein 1 FlgK [Pseudomonas sagittaria]